MESMADMALAEATVSPKISMKRPSHQKWKEAFAPQFVVMKGDSSFPEA
jgi:hypothetical protein